MNLKYLASSPSCVFIVFCNTYSINIFFILSKYGLFGLDIAVEKLCINLFIISCDILGLTK